jgi:UDP-N-acetylmuramoyl-tripeptide--D-alanyl-D-alanine ligase
MKKIFKKIVIWILQTEAKLVLKKYKPKIIAVTGNVGKTSVKDMIHTALSSSFLVRKSEKSYNSELGVPLTILGRETGWNNPFTWISIIFEGFALLVLKNHYPKWLVLEVGADRPGDIQKISSWLKPDIVVVTRFGDIPVHVEYFNSPDALVEEKSHLVSALKKDGLLILNNDDEKALSMKRKFDGMVMTYGFKEGSALLASRDQIIYKKNFPVGATFKVDYNGKSMPVTLSGVLGKQHIYPALAALSVGGYLKLNMVRMSQALETHVGAPGRMRIIKGIKEACIIDDTYNASPVAMDAALETLKEIKTTGKKIAVLGDMLELGKYTMEEHKRIGEVAGSVCDLLIVVGLRAKWVVEGALLGGIGEKNVIEFSDSQEAGKYLEHTLGEGDIVLVKGSQRVRMERTVAEIMAHPEDKVNLLVRQEKEWMER